MKQDITFTDAEKRIFLAAIGRERGICEKVDAENTNDPEAINLVRVCDNIEKKVKAALWSEPAVSFPQRHENDHFAEADKMDCISRQAVRLIESDPDAYPQEWNNDYEVGFTDALNKVLALPSAQPEQRWIPCEERLPEDNTRVLVTFANGFVGTSSWHESTKPFNRGFDNCMNGIKEDGSIIRFGVVAWMPLPEPWKEGEADG